MREKGLAVYAGQMNQGDEESIKNCLTEIIKNGDCSIIKYRPSWSGLLSIQRHPYVHIYDRRLPFP